MNLNEPVHTIRDVTAKSAHDAARRHHEDCETIFRRRILIERAMGHEPPPAYVEALEMHHRAVLALVAEMRP